MSEKLLRIRNLRVQFGRLLAVNDVSFELGGGELLGMIGPNGAGKSTTLRAAAGLQPITSGAVHIMNYDISKQAPAAGLFLGFAPDTPVVHDQLTVDQFLTFIGDAYRLPRQLCRERVDYWLESLWLSDKRGSKIATLSRGMRQRLQVARALLPDPAVVLLDEPAAGLDPAGRVHFRRLLANLRDQGKAIIVSSHILADLAEYCTHIGIMGHGRLLQFGTVAEISGAVRQDRSNYKITLAQRTGDLPARLNDFVLRPEETDGPRVIEADGDTLLLEYGASRDAAAELLDRLIRAGLPVCEFNQARADLEQAYLRTGLRQVD